jgi:lambda family phage portal protein
VETTAAAPVIRARARHVVANNGYAANGVAAWESALVGAGILAASAHPDEAARTEIDAALDAWSRECDADGLTDLAGIQSQVARALVVDGEAFVHAAIDGDGLRLRVIPAEMVDESDTRDLPNGGRTVAGVEFDAAGRRVAYRVFKHRPNEIFGTTAETVRISASDVCHVMRPAGAGQVRGTSWLAPVLLRLRELDGIEDALAVGVRVAALHAGFLVDQNGLGQFPFDGDQIGGVMSEGLEPGTVRVLPAGYDVKFSTPAQVQQVGDLLSHEIRAIAAGLGVPAHLVDGDLRNANYSSLRASLVAFRQRVEAIQFQTLIPQLVRPVLERAVTSLILTGRLDVSGDPADYLAADFYPPAQPWVDPAKDIAATREAIDGRLMSRRQAVAALGYSVERLDQEIAADRARETRLGIAETAPVQTQSGGDNADPAA